MPIPADEKSHMFQIAERMLLAAIRKEEAGDTSGCDMWLYKAVAKEAEANAFS